MVHLVAATTTIVVWLVLLVALCAANIVWRKALNETYADDGVSPDNPGTGAIPSLNRLAGSIPMTPADYAKLIPINFDATRPVGLKAYVPPSGGGLKGANGANTLPNLAPVLSQVGGTCYAHAAVTALRYWNMNHRSPPLPKNVSLPSRTYGYRYYPNINALNGGNPCNYVSLLMNMGGPNEQLWPHLWVRWYNDIIPSPKCFALAVRNSMDSGGYIAVRSAADVCKAIDNGLAVIISLTATADPGGLLTLNSSNYVLLNPSTAPSCRYLNHDVCVVGYDSVDGGRFLVQNSWGTGWGKNGFFYMHQTYFTTCVLPYAYVLEGLHPYTPAHHSATVTITPGKTTAVQVTNGAGNSLTSTVLQDVKSSACAYNDVHVQINDFSRIIGSVQLLFDVTPAGGYILKVSAFVGPYATLAVSLDGVERQFKGDADDCVEETIAVKEVPYAKLLFT